MPASPAFITKRKRLPLALLLFIFCGGVLCGRSVVCAQSVRTETQAKTKPVPTVDSDLAQWATLKNIYGWEIKYPKGWDATGQGDAYHQGDTSPQDGYLVWIRGPLPCNSESQRCATIAIAVGKADEAGTSTNDFLRLDPASLFGRLKKFELAGASAMEACWFMNAIGPACSVGFEHKGLGFGITYDEGGKDDAQIRSPKDWKYESIFEKMLKTFSFCKATETRPPYPD